MSAQQIDLLTVAAPEAADYDNILSPLLAFNAAKAGPTAHLSAAILIRDVGTGKVVGGLWGESSYDWMFVKLLFIPEGLRGAGLGRRIMAEAERVATARGCLGIWLDTFEFQARGFYEKLGYAVFGALDDHPRGMQRFFLRKRLPAGPPEGASRSGK